MMSNNASSSASIATEPGARTILRWLLAIVGAGAALLVLAGWSLCHWADRRTESQFQRLRDAGGPASLAEFHALHPPPSRETAAANLWLQAAIVLNAADSPELFQQWMPPEGGPAPSIPSVESRQRRALELNSVPRDPFDAQPMRYRQAGTECMLYSIGRNNRDDGGTLHDLRQGDLLYELRVPPNGPPSTAPPANGTPP